MQDILLSLKQYQALIKRLDEINDDVTSIKLKTQPEARYIDNPDLLKILHVTNRTIQRWRKSGKLLFTKIGNRFYYNLDLVLECVKLRDDGRYELGFPMTDDPTPEESHLPFICEHCPLFWLFNNNA